MNEHLNLLDMAGETFSFEDFMQGDLSPVFLVRR